MPVGQRSFRSPTRTLTRLTGIESFNCATDSSSNINIMNSLLHELRLAVRSLLKRPGFAFVAILTLALGIGASTAIFSVLDAVLLRPLPYPNQERIVELSELNESGRAMPFTEPNFNDLG